MRILLLAMVCWQYPQECICKGQMYIYNMNQTFQLYLNYLLKLHVWLYRHLKEKHQSGAGLQNRPVNINHPDQYHTITKEFQLYLNYLLKLHVWLTSVLSNWRLLWALNTSGPRMRMFRKLETEGKHKTNGEINEKTKHKRQRESNRPCRMSEHFGDASIYF
jgi:hypothetical protein